MTLDDMERIVAMIDKLVNVQNNSRLTGAYDIERAIAKLAKQVADSVVGEEALPF